ncbi:hypothetical protein [Streptomyces melanogenes]|uniref:hypothetical protein n=1 Tax=Streptomyces melanogenes TaxID=67326 RepID=UPI00167F03C2|nr:hypothetical protein [Streptomyces melanogenes]GGP93800.1 hypothetical protein GCM10010278_84780 [Streptomyces melanogenes]
MARHRRESVEEDIRLLIVLGREFTGPRPYGYAALARTVGVAGYLVRWFTSGAAGGKPDLTLRHA